MYDSKVSDKLPSSSFFQENRKCNRCDVYAIHPAIWSMPVTSISSWVEFRLAVNHIHSLKGELYPIDRSTGVFSLLLRKNKNNSSIGSKKILVRDYNVNNAHMYAWLHIFCILPLPREFLLCNIVYAKPEATKSLIQKPDYILNHIKTNVCGLLKILIMKPWWNLLQAAVQTLPRNLNQITKHHFKTQYSS